MPGGPEGKDEWFLTDMHESACAPLFCIPRFQIRLKARAAATLLAGVHLFTSPSGDLSPWLLRWGVKLHTAICVWPTPERVIDYIFIRAM